MLTTEKTEIDDKSFSFCQSLSSEHFQSLHDWVESDQALWRLRKLQRISHDPAVYYWPIAACITWEYPAQPVRVYQHQIMAATARRRKPLTLIGIYFVLKRRWNCRQFRQRHYHRKPLIMLHDEQGVYNNLVSRVLQLKGSFRNYLRTFSCNKRRHMNFITKTGSRLFLFSWVELDWALWTLLRHNSTQLEMLKTSKTCQRVDLSWVIRVFRQPDPTQHSQLSWVR